MGLDWIVQPYPDEDEQEQHEYEPTFRGARVTRSKLPQEIAGEGFTDMIPSQMRQYAFDLQEEVECNDYSPETIETVTEATDWLAYWADQGRSVYAWW